MGPRTRGTEDSWEKYSASWDRGLVGPSTRGTEDSWENIRPRGTEDSWDVGLVGRRSRGTEDSWEDPICQFEFF